MACCEFDFELDGLCVPHTSPCPEFWSQRDWLTTKDLSFIIRIMNFERSKNGGDGRRVSVYDVARAAGVSHQSVSNVLNKPERVRSAMRDKVMAAIEELGYEASAAAKALGSGRTNILGLQIPRLRAGESGGFFEHFTLALAEAARLSGQQILVFTTEDDDVTEHSRLFRAGLIDGIVIAETKRLDARIVALSELSIPFVAFGRTADEIDFSWVDVDNSRAIQLCVERLIGLGHRRIAYLESARDTFYSVERAEGFRVAMAEARAMHSPMIAQPNSDRVSAERAILALLDAPEPPTAVIAGSDLLAAWTIEAVRQRGATIGAHEFAVITFDDTVLASALNPPVTAVHQPIKEIATAAIELLQARLAGTELPNRLIEPALVIRVSG